MNKTILIEDNNEMIDHLLVIAKLATASTNIVEYLNNQKIEDISDIDNIMALVSDLVKGSYWEKQVNINDTIGYLRYGKETEIQIFEIIDVEAKKFNYKWNDKLEIGYFKYITKIIKKELRNDHDSIAKAKLITGKEYLELDAPEFKGQTTQDKDGNYQMYWYLDGVFYYTKQNIMD